MSGNRLLGLSNIQCTMSDDWMAVWLFVCMYACPPFIYHNTLTSALNNSNPLELLQIIMYVLIFQPKWSYKPSLSLRHRASTVYSLPSTCTSTSGLFVLALVLGYMKKHIAYKNDPKKIKLWRNSKETNQRGSRFSTAIDYWRFPLKLSVTRFSPSKAATQL